MKIKKLSASWVLFVCFILSIIYAVFSIGYKIKNFGFSINPNENVDAWLVEARISFVATGEPIKITLTAPNNKMILGDLANAEGYEIHEESLNNKKKIQFTKDNSVAGSQEKLYYKILLLENKNIRYNFLHNKPNLDNIEVPYFSESQKESAKSLLNLAKNMGGNFDFVSNLIMILNQKPAVAEVNTFIPLKTNQRKIFDITKSLLALERVPVRMIRGIKLVEGKSFQRPDLLLEAYVDGKWNVYNLDTGIPGVPDDFLVFQHGGGSLLDIEGGKNSKILFSVLKNKYNALFLSKYKAELNSTEKSFKYSMYNLPVREQNTFKFITVFPLAILAIVILRNIVGIKTLGTFTPMLIAMSFIETGLLYGLISFVFLISIGLLIRRLFSKLNLLLVPRISAVVILVIFIMQILTIVSYNMDLKVGLSLIFFPLIITAWIIEKSSILMEESGEKEVVKQNITTLIVAVFTYWVISSQQIRYIMYVFNELNICILFLVMLIGTYTGYRLTELIRFKPLAIDLPQK